MEKEKERCIILFHEIFTELNEISSQLSTQKGVGMEYCREKIDCIQKQYQDIYKQMFMR